MESAPVVGMMLGSSWGKNQLESLMEELGVGEENKYGVLNNWVDGAAAY